MHWVGFYAPVSRIKALERGSWIGWRRTSMVTNLLLRAALFRVVRAGMDNWVDLEAGLRTHAEPSQMLEGRLME